ncbi:MAG: hypothetical protein ABIG30_01435 [Candidatus Aenigmatarchaeota archaeon]
MQIAVYGSAGGKNVTDVAKQAREVGRVIARHKHILVTGACPGLPYEAVLGANEFDGRCIGYSPAIDLRDHVDRFAFPCRGFSEIIYMSEPFCRIDRAGQAARKKIRNVFSAADAGVIISGRAGTLNEFTLLFDMGKRIGVLKGTGGVADNVIPVFLETTDKPSDSKIVFSDDPEELIIQLESV